MLHFSKSDQETNPSTSWNVHLGLNYSFNRDADHYQTPLINFLQVTFNSEALESLVKNKKRLLSH